MDKYQQWLADNCQRTNIITSKGTDLWKYEFKTFEEVESFFVANIDRWKANNQNTKVIGTSIMVFSK